MKECQSGRHSAGPIFVVFVQFSRKTDQKIRLAPNILEICALISGKS